MRTGNGAANCSINPIGYSGHDKASITPEAEGCQIAPGALVHNKDIKEIA
jgi:hypothetical protein